MTRDDILHISGEELQEVNGSIPIPVVAIAKNNDLEIIESDIPSLDGKPVGGMLAHIRGEWVILIQASDSLVRKRFTIAHEMGHFLLHFGDEFLDTWDQGDYFTSATDDEKEKEANIFASHLLLPETRVRELWPACSSVEEAARKFEVSEVIMVHRLQSLGLLHHED